MDQSIQSGGGGRSLFYILKFINQNTFRPIAILPDEKGILTDRIKEEKVCELINEPLLHSSNRLSRTPGKTRLEENMLQRLISRFRNYLDVLHLGFVRLPQIIRNQNIDILYSNNDTTRILSLIAGSLTSTRVVWHIRNVSKSRWWSILTRSASIKRTIFISHAQRELFRVPSEKTVVVYNGIDIHEFKMNGIPKKLRSDFNIPSNAFVIGVTGRLLPKKGYISFLKAGKMAIEQCPNSDIRLAVIGGAFSSNQEKYLSKLKTLAETLQISHRLVFTGFQKDIKSYVSDLNILAVPSIWDEPFGRTALEGMALGIPVIASRVGGLPEVIENGVNGILFEKENENEMAQAMIRLVRSPELCREMGLNGRRITESKFDICRRTEDIESTLLKLTDGTA